MMSLELGYRHPFEIRKYCYLSEKLSGTSILYLSDLHFNRYGCRLAESIAQEIDRIKPGILLLGGDYADSAKGMYYFHRLMESLAGCKNVFAIAGNHDRWSKSRLKQVREIIETCNGVWIDNGSAIIRSGRCTIRIDGSLPAAPSADVDLSILSLHAPIDVTRVSCHYDLIFAGHLHGCQVVLKSTKNGLYPGRLIYKWNRLSADFGNSHYFISKGLGDTLPIRYNCRKDVILVEILNP